MTSSVSVAQAGSLTHTLHPKPADHFVAVSFLMTYLSSVAQKEKRTELATARKYENLSNFRRRRGLLRSVRGGDAVKC